MEHKKFLRRALSSILALCMMLCSMQLMTLNTMAADGLSYARATTRDDLINLATINYEEASVKADLDAKIVAGTFFPDVPSDTNMVYIIIKTFPDYENAEALVYSNFTGKFAYMTTGMLDYNSGAINSIYCYYPTGAAPSYSVIKLNTSTNTVASMDGNVANISLEEASAYVSSLSVSDFPLSAGETDFPVIYNGNATDGYDSMAFKIKDGALEYFPTGNGHNNASDINMVVSAGISAFYLGKQAPTPPTPVQGFGYKQLFTQDDVNNRPNAGHIDIPKDGAKANIDAQIAAGTLLNDATKDNVFFAYKDDNTKIGMVRYVKDSSGKFVYSSSTTNNASNMIAFLNYYNAELYYPLYILGAEVVGSGNERYLIVSVPEENVDDYSEIGIKAGKNSTTTPTLIGEDAIVDKTAVVFDTITDGATPVETSLTGKLFAFKVTGLSSGSIMSMIGYGTKADGTRDISQYIETTVE